jgi:antitoxin HicB
MKQHVIIMKVLNCRILLRKELEGGYTVTVPSLPGCITYGDTIEEAKETAKEAIELYIEILKENREKKTKKGFKFDWEYGLTKLKEKYTSVELQHKALEWR